MAFSIDGETAWIIKVKVLNGVLEEHRPPANGVAKGQVG